MTLRQRDVEMAAAKLRDFVIVAVLGTVTLSGPLALHFFLPAVPHLKQEFGVSSAVAQTAFSITLLVMAASTLTYGSLSDRFGRRAVLIGGLLIFIAGSAVCALSDSIATLIAGRLLQAFGAGSGLVLSRAIAHDIFAGRAAVRILAYLTMAYSLGPMIAPPIGGWLVDGIGWRAIFAAAAIAIAVTVGLVLLVLPGGPRREAAGAPARPSLLRGYGRLFASLRFNGFVLQPACGSAVFFAHASAATFLMNEMLRRPASEFGLYFLFFPIGYWFGTLVASRLGGRVASERMVLAGAVITFVAVVALALCVLLDWLTPLTLFAPAFFVTLGQGLSLPNAQAGAMGTDRSLAGTAAGVSIFLQLLFGAVSSQLTGLFADGTADPMIAILLVAGTLEVLAALLLWLPGAAAPAQPSGGSGTRRI